MENLTHTLVGAALAETGLKRTTVLAIPALLVAANLPDIDIFGSLVGQNYLDFHRGITHSLPGVAALSLILATAVWVVSRLSTHDPTQRVRFAPMLWICLLGTLSNPLLDLLNDYGSRPWLPFSNRWYYGDLLSIADPWLWILFGSPLVFVPRKPRGRILLAACFYLAAGLVFLAGGVLMALAWAMVFGVALILGKFLKLRGFNLARIALLVFFVYLCGLAVLRERVMAVAREGAPDVTGSSVEQIDVLPGRPGSWGRWTVILQTKRAYFIAETGLSKWKDNPPAFETFEKNLDQPAYRESLKQEQMGAMARFARFPCVVVEHSGSSCTVLLSDLRYARHNRAGWGVARAVVPCGSDDAHAGSIPH